MMHDPSGRATERNQGGLCLGSPRHGPKIEVLLEMRQYLKKKKSPLRRIWGSVDKCLLQFSKHCPDVPVAILGKTLLETVRQT